MARSGELRRYLLPIKPKYLLVLLETCRQQTEEDRKRTNFSQPESSSNFGSGSKGHVALYAHQDGADLRQPRNHGVGPLRCGCTMARVLAWELFAQGCVALHGCTCILGAELQSSFVLIKNLLCNLSACR